MVITAICHAAESAHQSETVNDERCYTDRDDFQEDMEYHYSDFDGSDKEFEIFIENELLKYDPYWKPCIIVYVDN